MTRFLYVASLLFLTLPYPIFAAGWLRAPWSLVLIALVLVCGGLAIKDAWSHFGDGDSQGMDLRQVVIGLIPVGLVVLFTGMGGVGFQDTDYLRGNAIIRDLVREPWPVVYDTSPESLLLVYYTAFWLPAAFVGKLLGWEAGNVFFFLYGAFGVGLAALWFVRATRVSAWWCVPLFLAFSGMDVIGFGLRTVYEMAIGLPMRPWRYLEWWAGYGVACYPSNIDLLVFAPKQALPAWMLTAMALIDAREGRLERTGVLYLGLSTLWAPYVSMGLLPVILVLSGSRLFRERRVLEWFTAPNVLGGVLGLVSVAYMAARLTPHVLPIDVSNLHQEHLTLTLFRRGPAFLVIYPLFVAFEFALLHAFLYGVLRKRRELIDPPLRNLLYLSTALLTLLPWINLSWNNDIVMRASIPLLFTTALVTARVLADRTPTDDRWLRWARIGVVVVVTVGVLNALQIFHRQVSRVVERGSIVAIVDPDQVLDLFELQGFRYDAIGYNFAGQYMGSLESPFARHLMAEREGSEPSDQP